MPVASTPKPEQVEQLNVFYDEEDETEDEDDGEDPEEEGEEAKDNDEKVPEQEQEEHNENDDPEEYQQEEEHEQDEDVPRHRQFAGGRARRQTGWTQNELSPIAERSRESKMSSSSEASSSCAATTYLRTAGKKSILNSSPLKEHEGNGSVFFRQKIIFNLWNLQNTLNKINHII